MCTKLVQKIEHLRIAMYEAYMKNNNKEEVLRISQQLDELINSEMRQKRETSE